jgi:hypothetical protein
MFYKEHEPAHFHAEHGGHHAKVDCAGNITAGEIRSRKARDRIKRWAEIHREQLEANWPAARKHRAAVRGEDMLRTRSISSRGSTALLST